MPDLKLTLKGVRVFVPMTTEKTYPRRQRRVPAALRRWTWRRSHRRFGLGGAVDPAY